MANDWTTLENDAIVADYFVMLAHDIANRAYSKAEHRRALQRVISRPEGAIEFKHQNISAVLLGLGQPWIIGYKPASNFQGSLVEAVVRYLEQRPDWLMPLATLPEVEASLREDQTLWIGPAPTFSNEPVALDLAKMAVVAQKFDVAERDARNRALGRAGEERVFIHERTVLRAAGRDDLAKQVVWTSNEHGDGAGYDISSFEADGSARLLEVKTTNGWERTPFHITRNELAVAEERRNCWHLIRLWNFAREPKAFAIRPPLAEHVALTPTSFLAHLH